MVLYYIGGPADLTKKAIAQAPTGDSLLFQEFLPLRYGSETVHTVQHEYRVIRPKPELFVAIYKGVSV